MRAKVALLLLLILAFSLRAHPLTMDSFKGPDPYFHARLSQQTLDTGFLPVYDELSMQGRPYSYALIFHTLFATFSSFTSLPIELLIRLLPALYGAAAALLAFVIGRKFFTAQIGLFAALALSIMPMHISRTASYARPDGLSLLIVPAVIYLAYRGNYGTAALLCIFMALLHPLSSFYLFVALLTLALLTRIGKIKTPKISPKKIFVCVFLGTITWLAWLFSLPYSPLEYLSPVSFESAELKAFSLQSILLFFTFSWLFVLLALPKLRHNFLLAWFSVSVAFALIGTRLGIFLTMPVALLAGFGIDAAVENSKKHVKYILLLVFLLALLTALPKLAMHGKYVSFEERAAMSWLAAGNSGANAVIASQWDQGHPLAYYTNRKVVIDGYFEFAPNLEKRNSGMRELIYTSDCAKINSLIRKYSITHFYVPSKSMGSEAYLNGILEARDCEAMDSAYASGRARIFSYSG